MDNQNAMNGAKSDSALSLVAMIFGNFVGLQGPILIPIWLGYAITAFQLSEGASGLLATTELGAIALASLLISTRMAKIDRRHVAWVGIVLAVGGNIASIDALQNSSQSMFFALRGITGLGEGLIIACVSAAAAGTLNPPRTFAFMTGGFIGIASLVFAAAPYAVEMFPTIGFFGIMAILGIITGVTFFALPPRADSGATIQTSTSSPFSRKAIAMLFGYALANACFTAVWTFVGQIGIQTVQLDLEMMGSILAAATLLGILGPVIATFVANRYGKTIPVIMSLSVYWIVVLILCFSSLFIPFVAAVIVASIVVMYFITIMMTRFAAFDVNGSVAAAGPAFQSLGNAIGPALSGAALVLLPGWTGLALVGTILLVVSAVLILRVGR